MKICAKQFIGKNTEVLYFPTNPRQCRRQVSGNTLQQVEKFKYLGVVFTSDGRRSPRMWIHGLAKLTHFCVTFTPLWHQNGSFQTPQSCQFSNRSLFQSLPRVMNLGNDRKNISDILRCKHQRWNFCKKSRVWQGYAPRLDWARARNKFGTSVFELAVRHLGVNICIEEKLATLL